MGIKVSVSRGEGDMKKDDYDPDKDGVIAEAQIDTGLMRKSDYDGNDDKIVKGAYVQGIASNTLLGSSDAVVTCDGLSYIKKKELTLTAVNLTAITLRIKFSLGSESGSILGYGRIYRNNVAVGTERSKAGAYQEFSEDIAGWANGDLIQLYMKTENASYNALAKEFRVYGSFSTENESAPVLSVS